MRSRRRFRPFASAAIVLALSAPVGAQPSAAPATADASAALVTVEGRVLGQEQTELVVDVGSRAGVKAEQIAELWRPLKLKNPVTGKVIEDRYRIGSLRITEVLEITSFARLEGEARRPPTVGDIVVLRVARPAPAAPAPTRATPATPATPNRAVASTPAPTTAPVVPAATAPAAVDPDAQSVTDLLESLRTLSLEERQRRLESWLAMHPSSRFTPEIRDDANIIGALLNQARANAAWAAAGTAHSASGEPRALNFRPVSDALARMPVEIGVELDGAVRGAVLHTRHTGEVAYVSTPMHRAQDRYWVATVPKERVRAPSLEYFIEAVRPDGSALPVIGQPEAPLRAETPDRPTPAPALEHRSVASIYTDYADYNRLRGNDTAWQTEGWFGMRFGDEGVRALRSGFGVYRGHGGSIEELDVQREDPRRIGLTYGYLEGEFGLSRTFSLIGRLVLGLDDSGLTGGGQAHLRIGSDLETNLLIGGELLGAVGLRGVAELQLFPQGRVPFMVRTEVTNQPAGTTSHSLAPNQAVGRTDVGGRIILQGGYRVVPSLVIFARVSGEGRTIYHAGPGFGAGATYEW